MQYITITDVDMKYITITDVEKYIEFVQPDELELSLIKQLVKACVNNGLYYDRILDDGSWVTNQNIFHNDAIHTITIPVEEQKFFDVVNFNPWELAN